MHEKQLTVSELIELLEKMPQDCPVFTEGCDCYGDANSVELDENTFDERVVVITRI